MNALNVNKAHVEIDVIKNVDFKEFFIFMNDVSPLYPHFREWFYFTFRRGFFLNERKVVCAHNGDRILGAALLKQDKYESKICTFYVAPFCRHQNIGKKLMDKALAELDSCETFITVSEERVDSLVSVLVPKGFSLTHVVPDFYREGRNEYFYSLR